MLPSVPPLLHHQVATSSTQPQQNMTVDYIFSPFYTETTAVSGVLSVEDYNNDMSCCNGEVAMHVCVCVSHS